MIDHVGLVVSNFKQAREFYLAALAPLGYAVVMEGDEYCGIGIAEGPDAWVGTIWLTQEAGTTPTHIAFRAGSRALVDAFHKAAVAAGGKDNGAPGIRAHYHENYYGAFVLDADGNNIEAVCHKPE